MQIPTFTEVTSPYLPEIVSAPPSTEVAIDAPAIPSIASMQPSPTDLLVMPVPGVAGRAGVDGYGSRNYGEVPVGVIDGSNRSFSTAQMYIAGQIEVYLNGLREVFFTQSPPTITFSEAPDPGDTIVVDYTVAV